MLVMLWNTVFICLKRKAKLVADGILFFFFSGKMSLDISCALVDASHEMSRPIFFFVFYTENKSWHFM